MLNRTNVSNDSLAAAVCLADNALADEFFEHSLALIQIRTNNHLLSPRPELKNLNISDALKEHYGNITNMHQC